MESGFSSLWGHNIDTINYTKGSLRLVTLRSIYNLVTVKKHRTPLENMNGGSSDYSPLAYLSQTSSFVYLIEFVDFDQH